jgi:hypothetical protein
VKLVGPEKTVTQWNDSFLSFLKSFNSFERKKTTKTQSRFFAPAVHLFSFA